MRVGIEGSLFFKQSSGVGNYAKRLTETASKLDSDVDFEIVRHWIPFKRLHPPIKPNGHLSYRLVKWFPPMVYYQAFKRLNWFLPYDLIALRNYDAFLFFNFVAFPVRKRTKSIVVIHDLSFIHYPQFAQATNLKFMPKLTAWSIKRADHIITVSDNSKREIVEYYKVPADWISVVPNAVDHEVFYPRSTSDVERARRKYGLPEKYVHFHGTIEPRKNIVGVLDAYANLPQVLKDSYGLVLSGGKGWSDDAIYRKINELKKSGHNIVLPGYIDGTDDLATIYTGAAVFVWPSFYEGFGVPPLEAMACGVPVITSDNSSLPEAVGAAAIMVRASDIMAISKAMSRVITDSKLAAELRQKGLVQTKKFSWNKSAQLLIDILDRINN